MNFFDFHLYWRKSLDLQGEVNCLRDYIDQPEGHHSIPSNFIWVAGYQVLISVSIGASPAAFKLFRSSVYLSYSGWTIMMMKWEYWSLHLVICCYFPVKYCFLFHHFILTLLYPHYYDIFYFKDFLCSEYAIHAQAIFYFLPA